MTTEGPVLIRRRLHGKDGGNILAACAGLPDGGQRQNLEGQRNN